MASKAAWRDQWEYLLARALDGGLTGLPEAWAERLGAELGRFTHAALGVRRRVVESNLRRAFPEADDAWIRRTARDCYAHLGREAVAMLRLHQLSAAEVARRTPCHGWDELEAVMREGRGVILVTGHVGNWEVSAAALTSRGYPIDAVMKRLRNPRLDAWLDQTRRRLGIGTIDMASAPRQVPRSLAAGRAVGLVADQDARHSGVFVPFFGHPASTHRGPALFALRLGVPIFLASALRTGPGMYRASVERIRVERTGDLEEDVRRVTLAWTAGLERVVRSAPEQYFWFHKRWKTAPPAEPGVPGPGTT